MAQDFKHERFFTDDEWRQLSQGVCCLAVTFGEEISCSVREKREVCEVEIWIKGKARFEFWSGDVEAFKIFPATVIIRQRDEAEDVSELFFALADECSESDGVDIILTLSPEPFADIRAVLRTARCSTKTKVELGVSFADNGLERGIEPSPVIRIEDIKVYVSSESEAVSCHYGCEAQRLDTESDKVYSFDSSPIHDVVQKAFTHNARALLVLMVVSVLGLILFVFTFNPTYLVVAAIAFGFRAVLELVFHLSNWSGHQIMDRLVGIERRLVEAKKIG